MTESMASPSKDQRRAPSQAEWEKFRPVFTQLYIEENRPLPEVMGIMREKHGLWASEKMYKNKIKHWGLRKYLKEGEAKQIMEGEVPTASRDLDLDALKKKAERALKRKRNRKSSSSNAQASPPASPPASPTASPLASEPSPSASSPPPPSPVCEAVVQWSKPAEPLPTIVVPPPERFRVVNVAEQFLFNLRGWTHDAFVHGDWDTLSSTQHHRGRQASRLLSSSLTAGINLFDNGKPTLAWAQWGKAFAGFQNPELFKSWYYEIPMALLFEVGRVAVSGHHQLAAVLLKNVKRWAHTFLDPKDSRHALFSVFGELEVDQLQDLYKRAARSMYDGLETRIDKRNKLLYEVRLNRALDLLWYDPETDLTEWLPQISEVDAVSPGLSVYFLLLQAYRLVAQDQYDEADDICSQVQRRLTILKETPGSIDLWRVGLAYRRLGRQQHAKGRIADARRSFNTALKYVQNNNDLSKSVLIEICQRQQSMANMMQDAEDVFFWTKMLESLEQDTKATQVIEELDPSKDEDESESEDEGEKLRGKKRRISPNPGRSSTPARRGTW
ncbi:uncharacterized protein PV07_11347 [Cladophialophora immunda]|uniref:Clr5 domain-containing protein n=1 Tax=Cladophialophora immunda TaxID=569365 RepID=A0A0D1Z6A5_9EURO|nr:uncharacterized protein PV07_11347 [Cladophialophora immunda]KIW23121.1 hypothetical protein PV07_11347 [Cladophialophora immunda]OQU93525.1 Clr5 domain-containing protein [Cladophialophora immunda]